MIPYIRRQIMLKELNKKNVVSLDELYVLFPDVSISTIRRDLRSLQKEGLVELLHGGAAKLKQKKSSYDVPFEDKKLINKKEKEKIAKFASHLINEGETIYIDSGTTTGAMIDFLVNKKIIVVTSNTKIIAKLDHVDFTCILLGGEVIKGLGSVNGGITNSIIADMYFDKAFIGASGFSIEHGINTPDFRERDKKRLVFQKSKQTYILVDDTKAGINTTYKVFDFNQCTIITNKDNEILDQVENYYLAT